MHSSFADNIKGLEFYFIPLILFILLNPLTYSNV